MHIKVDKDDKITSVHIEEWDKNALPEKFTDELLKFEGNVYEQDYLLSYMFRNEMFRHIKHLIIYREGKPNLICWWNSPLYGALDMPNFQIQVLKENSTAAYFTSIDAGGRTGHESHDTFLNPILKIPSETITLDTEEFSIEDLFQAHQFFQIGRNVKNSIDLLYWTNEKTNVRSQELVQEGHFSMLDSNNVIQTFSTKHIRQNIEIINSHQNLIMLTDINSKPYPESLELLAKMIIEKNKDTLSPSLDKQIIEEVFTTIYKGIDSFGLLPMNFKKQVVYFYYDFYKTKKDYVSKSDSNATENEGTETNRSQKDNFALKLEISNHIPPISVVLLLLKKKHPLVLFKRIGIVIDYIKYNIPYKTSKIKRLVQKQFRKPLFPDTPELDQLIN